MDDYDALMDRFLATPEMEELDGLIEAVREAAKAGQGSITVETKVLGRIVDDLSVGRLNLGFYRDHWNRFCDENNRPEYKIGQEQGGAAPDGGGPF